ncbi:MAG: Gfo/Idh/MocA family oxidoreductase [Pirellulaceae bacterium]|nr:Gfo/Idh/MocA family oxidoreductase [Pirellulaceae bacterium]
MGSEDSSYGLSHVPDAEAVRGPELDYLPTMPTDYRPKIGLIGAGGISEYHLRAYQVMGLDVVAICDLDESRAIARRDAFYPDAMVTDDYRRVLAIDEIEVVDITTHPIERVPILDAALKARKHVLSQKPFVEDLDDGERLVELAEQQGVKLAVNQNGRWAPHFRYLTLAVRHGVVGTVSSIDFAMQWDHTWTAGTTFEEIHHLLLYDFAIHWFDIATVLMEGQEPERIFATVRHADYQQVKPPFLAQAVVDFPTAQVHLGLNAHVVWGQEDQTTIVGQAGTLRATGPSLNEQRVQLWTEAGYSPIQLAGCWFENGFQGTMGELLLAIEQDREPENSARSVLKSLELCFAALASADRGEAVRPGEVRCI